MLNVCETKNIVYLYIIQQQQNKTDMKTTINFYHDSYQFETVITDLNVNTDFIEMKLAKAYEYTPMKGDWWATVNQDLKEVARYELKYGEGLFEIKFN